MRAEKRERLLRNSITKVLQTLITYHSADTRDARRENALIELS